MIIITNYHNDNDNNNNDNENNYSNDNYVDWSWYYQT